MYCQHLSLTNFRNYARLELDLPAGIIVLCGDNAAGKSNLLEALYYLATTKSFRASSDRELVNWMSREDTMPFFRLAADIVREGRVSTVEIAVREEGGSQQNGAGEGARGISKRLRMNGSAKRAVDIIGVANVVMFSPQDLDLVDGSPLVRRRYLDVTISQVDPRYVRALTHYNRVLTRRNHLLRLLRDHHGSADQLMYWDQELARAGAYIIARRRDTVYTLSRLSADIHRRLTNSQERFRALYRPSLDLANVLCGCAEDGQEELELEDASSIRLTEKTLTEKTIEDLSETELSEGFLSRLRRGHSRDISCGASLVGPHRDDLVFLLDDRQVCAFASRGQQRTVALALKLAETQHLRECTGELPILLLDDVLSELDRDRRYHVLTAIEPGQQVVITTTDLGQFEPGFLHASSLWRVERGALSPVADSALPR